MPEKIDKALEGVDTFKRDFTNYSCQALKCFLFGSRDATVYLSLNHDFASVVANFSMVQKDYAMKGNGYLNVYNMELGRLLIGFELMAMMAPAMEAYFSENEHPGFGNVLNVQNTLSKKQDAILCGFEGLGSSDKSAPDELIKLSNELMQLSDELRSHVRTIQNQLSVKSQQQSAQKQKEMQDQREESLSEKIEQQEQDKARAALKKEKHDNEYFNPTNRVGQLPTTLPADVQTVLTHIKAKNPNSAIVGGAIRDTFHGLTPNDYDIITQCSMLEIETLLAALGYRFYRTNMPGLIKATSKTGEPIDIQCISEDFDQNLARKDCTINALVCDPDGNIYGEGKHMADLRDKKIKLMGKDEPLQKDPTRIFRLCRLSTHVGVELSSHVKEQMKKAAPKISKLPVNIYHRNLEVVFGRGNASINFDLFKELGMLYALTGQDQSRENAYQGQMLVDIHAALQALDARVRQFDYHPASDEILAILARPFANQLLSLGPVSSLFVPGFDGRVQASTAYHDEDTDDLIHSLERMGLDTSF